MKTVDDAVIKVMIEQLLNGLKDLFMWYKLIILHWQLTKESVCLQDIKLVLDQFIDFFELEKLLWLLSCTALTLFSYFRSAIILNEGMADVSYTL